MSDEVCSISYLRFLPCTKSEAMEYGMSNDMVEVPIDAKIS